MLHLSAIALCALLALGPEKVARAPSPLTPAEAEELLTSPLRHVRALHPEIAEILREGVQRSATFGYLLAALQQTDVIVQIVASSSLPVSTPARVLLVPRPNAVRFIRIQVRVEGSDNDLVAIIGHELQHALEIAQAEHVRDDRSLIALYRRIGHVDGNENQFDSEAAHQTARQIRRELYTAAALAKNQVR